MDVSYSSSCRGSGPYGMPDWPIKAESETIDPHHTLSWPHGSTDSEEEEEEF